MKLIDAELLKSTRGLYFDIDTCITELLQARVKKNKDVEGKALFRMEGLMVATLQQLDCIIDSLQQEQQEEPDKSLEEEIQRYLREECSGDDEPTVSEIARHFAEWQKEQMMDEWLKDRDGCFWDGVNEGKKAMEEQMMKDGND